MPPSVVPPCHLHALLYTQSFILFYVFFLKQLLGLGRLCKLSACRVSVRFRSSAPLDALTYNPSFREAESGDPLRQAGLTILCVQGLQQTCLSTKVKSGGWRRYPKLNSSLYTQAPTHMWTQMRKHVHHTCMHMQQRLNGTYRNLKKTKRIIESNSHSGAMVHAYYPNIWEVETEVSAAPGQPWPHSEFEANLGYVEPFCKSKQDKGSPFWSTLSGSMTRVSSR